MTKKFLEVEAETLKEAREQVKSQIPEGYSLLSYKIISQTPVKISAEIIETDESAIESLINALSNNDKEIAKGACADLFKIGTSATKQLFEFVFGKNDYNSKIAVISCIQNGGTNTVNMLLERFGRGNFNEVYEERFMGYTDEQETNPIVEKFYDKQAIANLINVADLTRSDIVEIIKKEFLQCPHWRIRRVVIRRISEWVGSVHNQENIDTSKALELLELSTHDDYWENRDYAKEQLIAHLPAK